MKGKLALGTVQFGLDYGINNTSGLVSEEEVCRILDVAAKAGIDTLDTAHAYGLSEVVLGKQDLALFRIVTKLPPGTTSLAAARSSLLQSMDRLQLSNGPYAVMLHRFDDFGKTKFAWADFCSLKKEFGIERIGFSLYEPSEWWGLREKGIEPGIIQVPFNIFDRRFENVLADARLIGTEVHVRSVFLQGLFFREPASLPSHFAGAIEALSGLRNSAAENGVDLAAGLLRFVLRNEHIDRVVIGVVNAGQLQHNLTGINDIHNELVDVSAYDELPLSILNPAQWKT